MTLRSRTKPAEKPTAISLFSGAGGLDYGFEAAGYSVRVAHDFDQDSCATMRANRSFPVLCKDIHDTPSGELLEAGGLRKGEVSVLVGGPPCQPFSKSAYWTNGDTRRLGDPRARTLDAFMRCVQDALPKVFLLENVHGIHYSGKEEGFGLLHHLTQRINKAEGVSYALSWKVLNAADYGVPQIRQRFFLVGHRDGKRFEFPKPTHTGSAGADQPSLYESEDLPGHVTAWDAIGGLGPASGEDLAIRGRWADLLPSIPEGENYLWHTSRKGGMPLFGWRTRYWSFLLKLGKDSPSWTIQAQPGPAIGPFHWENRRLSVEEMARLQTFPKRIKFVGSRVSVQRQLGNAVPSLLAEVLAREIARQFFDTTYTAPLRLRIRLQRPIPEPSPLRPVPKKFRSLAGDHADHPGTGRGRAALHRSGMLLGP